MRNNFGTVEKEETGFHAGSNQATAASSPGQLAVVWSGGHEVVAASPVPGNDPESYDLDMMRYPTDFNLTAALKMRRDTYRDSLPLSERTHYLTNVSDFSERTRILALPENALNLNDESLIEWLLDAEKNTFLGTDNHPVFETPLEETSCSISRLPNGQVAMTEVPRRHIQRTRERIRILQGQDSAALFNVSIETPVRCVARYYLMALPEDSATLREEKELEVTAFFLISRSGFSYGLWSPSTGLFSEYAFAAPADISHLENRRANSHPNGVAGNRTAGDSFTIEQKPESSFNSEPENSRSIENQIMERYVRDAFDQLFLQLSQEKLDQFQLSGYAQVVWATETELAEFIASIATEYSANTGLDFSQIMVPFDEAIATGLLFGSFTFGAQVVAGAQIMPQVNMARDILVHADKEEIKRLQFEEIGLLKKRNRVLLALAAAPILVLACLLALAVDLFRSQIALNLRERNADARTMELKPAVDRRKSYEANLKWYQEFVTQVSRLREQQPVGIGLLYNLNTNYPITIDPSFYVADLKLLPNGSMEMKGLSRNKDAVTSFLRALEFAGGSESGTKLFSNLAYEVQENAVSTGSGQVSLPGMTGSTLPAGNMAPGVIAWNIKGNYVPAVKFAPPDPTKTPVPAPTPVVAPTP